MMVAFSDIQREEAVRICELLLDQRRGDVIPDALREGWTLADVRRFLAAENVPPKSIHADALEEAIAARLSPSRKG